MISSSISFSMMSVSDWYRQPSAVTLIEKEMNPGRHKEERENECMIDQFLSFLFDRSCDHSFLFFFYVPAGQDYDRHCEETIVSRSIEDWSTIVTVPIIISWLLSPARTIFSLSIMCDHMKEKRSSSCDKIRQEMFSFTCWLHLHPVGH